MLYLDTNRTTLIFSGKVIPKAFYAELSDGSRKRVPDKQATAEDGTPLWTVDVYPDDDETQRAEALPVTVASYEEPTGQKWRPIRFTNLRANVYVNQQSGRAAISLKADGIEGQKNEQPKAA
jgi:hypothetical protein